MTGKVRSFAILLDSATLIETEDVGSDGDEIYVGGQLVAMSPTQGTRTKVFPKDLDAITRFNDNLPATQRLAPSTLYRANLPVDTQVSYKLKFTDADDEASEDNTLSADKRKELRDRFDKAQKDFQSKVEENPKRSVIIQLVLDLVFFLFDLFELLDDDDVLGTDVQSFDLSKDNGRRFDLVATDDGASYRWSYRVVIGPVEDDPSAVGTRNPGTPVTPTPVPPVGDGDRPTTGDGDRPTTGDGDRPAAGDDDRPAAGDDDRPAAPGDGGRTAPTSGDGTRNGSVIDTIVIEQRPIDVATVDGRTVALVPLDVDRALGNDIERMPEVLVPNLMARLRGVDV